MPRRLQSNTSLGAQELTIPVSLFSTGWRTALNRAPRVECQTTQLSWVEPNVVSVRLAAPRIKTDGFQFPDSPSSPTNQSQTIGSKAPGIPLARRKGARIRPPSDVIKLQDRLYYLLQPSMDTLLSSAELRFPYEPFPYQYEGIAFLYPRVCAILADEMGLGKTMQAITTVRLLLRRREVKSVLLVCPKPLVTNWRREFGLWAPEVPVSVIEGNQHRRQWQWRMPDVPVRVANYELVTRDREIVTEGDSKFDLVILDEAQRIKNRASSTSQVIRSIRRSRSWALTGTPVENSSDDLVGIFEFLSPGFLSPTMTPYRMGREAGQYILRRIKDHVLTDLPPKMFRDAELELSPQQRETYELAESDGIVRLTELGDGLTVQHVFELVLRLKQICNFDPATGSSSKLERLTADLEEVAASGKKAIVFSQWVESLLQLAHHLQPFRPLQYHGRVPQKQREQVIQQFRDDKKSHVILMSYGAGSVGLNLQFCEYVFLFDRWWNPAVEDQAINRAHRIGAAGPVTVTRFLSLSTIEERIDEVLRDKRELFETILAQADRPSSMGLSQQEIFGLFNLKSPQRRAA